MGRYGITANALAPAARTAMTEAGMPDMVKAPDDGSFDGWVAENVAPLVVWLGSSQSAHVTGKMFESQGVSRISIGDGWRTDATRDKGARWESAELGPVIDHLLAEAVPHGNVFGELDMPASNDRRDFLKAGAALSGAVALGLSARLAQAASPALPLPEYDAL